MADAVSELLVRVTADGSQAIGVLNGVSATIGALADKNAGMLTKIGAVGNLAGTVGRTITKTIGAATVAGLVASAKAAGQLNKELANIGTLSVPTERLKEFKGQIQDIAVATGKSTSDIADGTYQVISAYGDAADTMEKVEINAKAAKAGLATTTDSINLTSAVTKAYGDTSASAVEHVADLAFKTVELGQTTFPELAASMGQVTSLSKELGISQEELFATYATLTGVTGNASEVQTQLKGVLNGLIKPSEKMQKVISGLGYESGYAMINALGFAGTLDALQTATGGSSEETLELFNNVRAVSGILPLVGSLSDSYTQKLEKMQNASGAATKAFEVQTEGIAKTGFTLEQAKVKMQVAAQNFGESAAPLIGDFAGMVDKAASALADMSDEERKGIINTGVLTTKIGVGLAVGGKAVTLGTKLVGTAKSVAGSLASVGIAAGPVAGVIGGVTLAVVGVKKAYDWWYDSQYRWSKGLSEGNEKVKESLDKYKQLSSIQGEIKDLRLVIENPDSSAEQVETAKSRLEEIAALLSEEYNLVINSDNSNLDKVVETVREISQNELQGNINSQMTRLTELQSKFTEYQEKRNELENDNAEALERQRYYSGLIREDEKARSEWYAEKISKEDYYRKRRKILDENNISYKDPTVAWTDIQMQLNKATADVNRTSQQEKDLKAAYEEYIAISTEMANWETELLGIAAKNRDSEGLQQALSDMSDLIEMAKLDMNGYAQAAALAMNGVQSLEDAWHQAWDGDNTALMGVVNDYIRSMQEFGATANETATGAALIQNGFRSIGEAAKEGKLTEVVNDFVDKSHELGMTGSEIAAQASVLKQGFSTLQEAVDAGALDVVVQQANELGKSMGLIPEGKHIDISATGDISLIDDATNKIEQIETDNVTVSVNADGDISILTDAGERKEQVDGAVSLAVNAEGNIDVLDQAGNRLAEIKNDPSAEVTVEGTVNYEEGETPDDVPDAKGKANFELGESPETVPDATGKANFTLGDYPTSIPAITATVNVKYDHQAHGTQYFSGGLAMVNDQRGISDPRELIVDRGRAFIPSGRDVILPLSRGAKVYTAAQTKAIMNRLGIPRYASGKDNSDGFVSARDDWNHYTKTHAVTV